MGLLFYIKVRWLLRGKCLSRLYELKNEVETFYGENKKNLLVEFYNEEFVVMLSYLADILSPLNDMNLSLQGRDVTVSDVQDKLAELTVRMVVWQARIKVGLTTSFPLLKRRLKMNKINLPDSIKTCIIEHLEIVSAEFRSYFNDDTLHGTETRLTLKLTLSPKKHRSWQSSKFRMR